MSTVVPNMSHCPRGPWHQQPRESRTSSLVSAGGRLATITNEPLQSERGISVSGFFVSPDGALLKRQAASFAERGLTIPVGAVYGLAEAGTALNAAVAGRLGGGIVVDPRR
jgi:hypothetical protein